MSLTQSLQQALSSKKIIPLVGAGVSMSIKDKNGNPVFPSWKDLLLSAAEKLKSEQFTNKAKLVEAFSEEEP